MAKAELVLDRQGKVYGIEIKCPGCHNAHVMPVRWLPAEKQESEDVLGKPRWNFNGDFDSPTFQPSIFIRTGHYADGTPADQCWLYKKYEGRKNYACTVCHSFVTNGKIQFLPDCTHELAGQTVDLPETDNA